MTTKSPSKSDTSPTSKKAYVELLRTILRTDVESKAALKLSKAMGDNQFTSEVSQNTKSSFCTLNSAIEQNTSCLLKIREMSDNVLVALMLVTSEKKEDPKVGQELARAIQSLITLTAEAVAISTRFHETAFGLHIVADFLRYPFDLSLLNCSNSGRVSLPHFSHVEASIMRLTWLHGAIEKALQDQRDLLSLQHLKIYSSFEEALRNLRDASKSSSQVFRVLLYSNPQGKLILQEFIRSLQPHERNDIILELNKLRVQHEQISMLFERVGWSLTDIWTEQTGKNMSFEQIQRESKARTEPLWNSNDSGTSSPNSTTTAKDKELRKKQKKKKGKKNKKGKDKSKKEAFMERLANFFGRKPSDFSSPMVMTIPPWAKKQQEEDPEYLAHDSNSRLTLPLPANTKPRLISSRTKMHLLKSVSSTSAKTPKATAAEAKFMRLKERGWK